MAYIDSANIKGTLYELQDTQARTDVGDLKSAVNGVRKVEVINRRNQAGYYQNNGESYLIHVNAGDVVTFNPRSGVNCYTSFLRAYASANVAVQFAEGYSGNGVLIGTDTSITAGNDAVYLLVMKVGVGGASDIRAPYNIYINGYDVLKTVTEHIVDTDAKVDNLSGRVLSIETNFDSDVVDLIGATFEKEIGVQKLVTQDKTIIIGSASSTVIFPVCIEKNTSYVIRCTYSSLNAKVALRAHGTTTEEIVIANGTSIPVNTGVQFQSSDYEGLHDIYIQIGVVLANDSPLLSDWICSVYAVGEVLPGYMDFSQNLIPENAKYDGGQIADESITIEKLDKSTALDLMINRRTIYQHACYGDSLTNGRGASEVIKRYPNRLQALINQANTGYSFINRGIGGEGSLQIATRAGAYYDYVEPFTIPADTTPVNITKSTNTGSLGLYAGQNPCVIAGVTGTLGYANNQFTFTRAEAGAAVTVTHRTPIFYGSAVDDTDKRLLIWMGTNDTSQTGGLVIDDLIERTWAMIHNNTSGQYIVIGLTINYTNRDELEARQELEFGKHYLNLRQYLLSYGLSDNDLTPTAEDVSAITAGNMPPQILDDGTHFNDYGYNAIANAVYQRGQMLGYWN